MRKQNKRHRKIRKCVAGPNFSGQHLLHDKRLIHKLIRAANIQSKDTVLEIGAGKGALTFQLAKTAGKVLAVENNEHFINHLRRKNSDHSNVSIIPKNILHYSLPKERFFVVANIPFAITTPILKKLMDQPDNAFQSGALIIEEGAAKRFTSRPITNPMILNWRTWFDLEIVQVVPRNRFSPPPKVDAAVLSIRRIKDPCIKPQLHRQFLGLAEYGLKHPQMPVFQAFKGVFTPPQIHRLVKNMNTDRNNAVCHLTEKQWGIAFHTMIRYVERFRWPKAEKKRFRG